MIEMSSMHGKPRVLAIIPARGGSKGLPRKNVLDAGGRPLIAWTIKAALGANCISRVVLSSDDDEIIAAARAYDCDVPFKRPAELATDDASSADVVLHALSELPGYDYVMLLQPTSPLRTADDIEAAFQLLHEQGAPSCVSLCAAAESPYWMYQVEAGGKLKKLLDTPTLAGRRQDLPAVYSLNGAIYIADTEWFVRKASFLSAETIGYVMPRSRSVDIDTRADFDFFVNALIEDCHE